MAKQRKPRMTEISVKELRRLEQKIDRQNAKKSNRAFDGFGPFLQQKMTSAMREVWRQSSQSRRIAVKRTDLGGGYSQCEHPDCATARHPKTYIDHIVPCGSILEPEFLHRLCVPSNGLQALCSEHHKAKTKLDNAKTRKRKTKAIKTVDDEEDFY